MKKKILMVFGTRPEAIKMAPLIHECQRNSDRIECKICVTAQHREMLDQVLDFFQIVPDYDLNLMKQQQSLHSIFANVLLSLESIFIDFKPDYVFVHGDTATSTSASLAAFFSNIQVVHIEAGLRTWNKFSPFPEEMNRQLTGRISDIHCAPTLQSKNNLLHEHVSNDSIIVTGNTVIDALIFSRKKVRDFTPENAKKIEHIITTTSKIILVTAHRRENFGVGLENICRAIKNIATNYPDVSIIFPVHLNPNVQKVVKNSLSNIHNIILIDPLDYPSFIWLMDKSYLILTDSGGVQEEAPSLGKPVLVLRDTTERPEAVDAGTVTLVGTNFELICAEVKRLVEDRDYYSLKSSLSNPYGDGKASQKIIKHVLELS